MLPQWGHRLAGVCLAVTQRDRLSEWTNGLPTSIRVVGSVHTPTHRQATLSLVRAVYMILNDEERETDLCSKSDIISNGRWRPDSPTTMS